MRQFKGLLPLLLVGAAGLAWLLFLSEPGSRWIAAFLMPPPSAPPIVGQVLSYSGALKRVHDGDVSDVGEGVEVRDGDRLETDGKGLARVRLNSQDELELKGSTSVSLTLWSPIDAQSPVYVTVLGGDVSLIKAGRRGRAYVVREGRLYLPDQKADHKPPGLRVTRAETKDLHLDTESEAEEAPAIVTGQTAKPQSSAEAETLANEYIDATIVEHQPLLQKCWLPRLKKNPTLKGALTMQLEINRRGRVREVKVTDRTLMDPDLERCVLSVFERLQFRPFRGPEISLSYPVTFE